MGMASLLIDDGVKGALDREAALIGVSPSEVAEAAIGAFLQAKSAKREAVAAAIVEVDKGVFISRDAMDRWVSSWGSANELPQPEPDIFPNR